jgi:hypothetical protein
MSTAPENDEPQPTATAPSKREKHPTYDVERLTPDGSAWQLVAQDVAAKNRREAVKAASAKLDPAEQYGTFKVARHGEARILTREPKVIETDDWS